MLNNRVLQVKMVKSDTPSVPNAPSKLHLDVNQITSDDARRIFVTCFGAYASVKLLNTACKIAVIAASK